MDDHKIDDLCSCYAEELSDKRAIIDALVAALEKAKLWTDEENDVGEWRQEADAALAAARK